MREYRATLHGYKVVVPPRCKLERLEPTTAEIIMPLHYAETAPVAMRTAGPLEYVGKDGNTYTWRKETIELFALDGLLWKRYDCTRWHDKAWTIEELAAQCTTHVCNENYLERYPYQWRSEDEPPAGLLVRDRGTWCTIENLRARVLQGCDAYAVIDGKLYEPANELVYAYDSYTGRGWGYRHEERAGRVIVAKEYGPGNKFDHFLCNALQDWREVNIYDEHTERFQDRMQNEITGQDVIEVFMPEYVKADPYADYWREEIRRHEERAENCIQAAKEHAERARALQVDARADRAAAARELNTAREISEKLENYLKAKEV